MYLKLRKESKENYKEEGENKAKIRLELTRLCAFLREVKAYLKGMLI